MSSFFLIEPLPNELVTEEIFRLLSHPFHPLISSLIPSTLLRSLCAVNSLWKESISHSIHVLSLSDLVLLKAEHLRSLPSLYSLSFEEDSEITTPFSRPFIPFHELFVLRQLRTLTIFQPLSAFTVDDSFPFLSSLVIGGAPSRLIQSLTVTSFPALRTLDIGGQYPYPLEHILRLSCLTNLTSLSLALTHNASPLSVLLSLTNLKSLTLHQSFRDDILLPLPPSVTSLDTPLLPKIDEKIAANLRSLCVKVSNCDFAPFSSLQTLRVESISVSQISMLTSITSIDARLEDRADEHSAHPFSPFKRLASLRTSSVINSFQIPSLTRLESLVANLQTTPIDLAPLRLLTRLEVLSGPVYPALPLFITALTSLRSLSWHVLRFDHEFLTSLPNLTILRIPSAHVLLPPSEFDAIIQKLVHLREITLMDPFLFSLETARALSLSLESTNCHFPDEAYLPPLLPLLIPLRCSRCCKTYRVPARCANCEKSLQACRTCCREGSMCSSPCFRPWH